MLRTVYGERMKKLTWMSAANESKSQEKAFPVYLKIGYPDKWKDYSTIDIQPDKLIENMMNINLLGT